MTHPLLRARSVIAPPGWPLQATASDGANTLGGESGARNPPAVSIAMSFGDLLEKLDGAVMGSFLGKNGNWMILTDRIRARISADALVKRPGARFAFGMRRPIASVIAGHRLPLASSDFDLCATAGIRCRRIAARIEATPGLIPVAISNSSAGGDAASGSMSACRRRAARRAAPYLTGTMSMLWLVTRIESFWS